MGKEYDNLIPPCPFEKGTREWVAWQSWLRLKLRGVKVGPPPGSDFAFNVGPYVENTSEEDSKDDDKPKGRRKKKSPPKIYKGPPGSSEGSSGRSDRDFNDFHDD